VRTAVRPQLGRDVPATPPARRLAAPSWRDPRLVVGVVLVLLGVVVGARVVAQARDTVGVWSLARPVGAGQVLTAQDLEVVQVRLDDAVLSAYVPVEQDAPANLVALRGLAPGELLASASLGRVGDLSSRPVTVPVAGNVPSGVAVASLVDLWVVPDASTDVESSGEPERLVEAAEVSAVSTGGTGLSARGAAEVQLLVPVGALPDVLRAVSGQDDLVLVPVPGGGPQ